MGQQCKALACGGARYWPSLCLVHYASITFINSFKQMMCTYYLRYIIYLEMSHNFFKIVLQISAVVLLLIIDPGKAK